MTRSLTFVASLLLLTVVALQAGSPAKDRPIPRLGIVFDGPWERNAEILSLINREISDAVGANGKAVIQPEKALIGDWTVGGAARLNTSLLADPEVDMVIGFGVFSSDDLCRRASLPKPVIAPIVVDPERQKLPAQGGSSGKKNLNYLVFPQTLLRDCALIRELTPFKKMVFLTSRRFHEGIAVTRPSDEVLGRLIGAEFISIRYDDRADEALAAIPPDADMAYLDIVPLSTAESKKLSEGLITRHLPSFSLEGERDVRGGIMAAANPDVFPRMVRRIVLNVQRILQGEDAGTLGNTFPPGRRLYINMKTAFAVGVSPRWTTMLEAELIDMESSGKPGGHSYSLSSAVQRMLTSNPDVIAKSHEVAARAEEVAVARSRLFPSLDVSVTGLQIDKDRAVAGMQPERRGTAEVSVSQVLFSEPVLANLSIQSSLQTSRESELELSRHNTIVEGATMYLNSLRTRRSFYIMLDNLKLARSNLELAQIRQSSGIAGPEEPLRWEVQIASLRKSVMDMYTLMNQSMLSLKQIMDLRLQEPVLLEDVSLDDPTLFLSNRQFLSYLDDPINFALLTDILVDDGLEQSHELRQLDAVIEAQRRNLSSLRMSFVVPSVVAFGSVTNTFAKSDVRSPFQLTNAPAPPSTLPPELPLYLGQLFGAITPQIPDRNDWNVGIRVSLNLFDGTSTTSRRDEARETLQQYEVQRDAVRQKVELRIRAQMESVKGTYLGIHQGRLEQQAAAKALGIVTESYSKGAISILSLLDAQNAALTADLVSANAFYDFVESYLRLERALGQYDLLIAADQRQAIVDRVLQRMAAAKAK